MPKPTNRNCTVTVIVEWRDYNPNTYRGSNEQRIHTAHTFDGGNESFRDTLQRTIKVAGRQALRDVCATEQKVRLDEISKTEVKQNVGTALDADTTEVE